MFYITLLSLLTVLVAALFLTPLRQKMWVAFASVVAAAIAIAIPAIGVLAGGSEMELMRISSPIFGEESLTMDSLSALFSLVIGIAGVSTLLYSRGYLAHYLDKKSSAHISLHYTALVVLVISMMLVVISSGGFSFLLAWELMTIASFILILFDAERQQVLRAALAYLIMMHIGFVLLVAGFASIFAATGSANFADLAICFSSGKTLPIFILFLLGFGMKAGLFPMHVWLPEAHPAAPSHVSAIMSGVMIKTGVYGVMRTLWYVVESSELHTIGIIILAVGVITGLWGVILAAVQNDAKRLLAYSSIENVGVIFIGLGIATLGQAAGNYMVATIALCGALLHTVNHSMFKSLLFFGAGNIYSQMHTTLLDRFGGVAKHMPMTAILFFIATIAICALPPLNGFIGEFLIYLGMLDSIRDGVNTIYAAGGMLALALIGGIVVLAFTKLYSTIFLGSPRDHHVAESVEVDNFRIAAMAIPTVGIILIGMFPQFAIRLVESVAKQFFPAATSTVIDMYIAPNLWKISLTAWLLVIIILLLYILKSRAQRTRIIEQGPTWGCGFTSPNIRMQYTGESYSEGLESIATSLTQNTVEGRTVGKSEIFPSSHRYAVRHKDKIDRLFAAWWVELLHIINKRIMSLRTGKINHYILFALLFLVAIFILSLFNWI
ncbi:MAG: NADH-quinone oxidoreductase subunit E [Rikenellaceae bacterium]|nr:NADH-quinone oxidoreductase subunit E [Rikenellaceae bacterium]